MKMEDIFCTLFGFSKNTYYLWKRQKRPIISLIQSYFSNDELEEFLNTGSIQKLELIQNIDHDELEKLIQLKKSIEDIL